MQNMVFGVQKVTNLTLNTRRRNHTKIEKTSRYNEANIYIYIDRNWINFFSEIYTWKDDALKREVQNTKIDNFWFVFSINEYDILRGNGYLEISYLILSNLSFYRVVRKQERWKDRRILVCMNHMSHKCRISIPIWKKVWTKYLTP